MLSIESGLYYITAYIDWIEPHNTGGQITDGYYFGGSKSGIDRLRSFYTEGYDISGGLGTTSG